MPGIQVQQNLSHYAVLCIEIKNFCPEAFSDKLNERLNQRWAKYGPRDDLMRPAGSYKKMNRSTEDAKTFSFAPHLYFRRTQNIQWKTGYARI